MYVCMYVYLLCKAVVRCSISVALAVDGRLSTSTNCIHLPVRVVVVHHMEVPVPTPAFIIVLKSFLRCFLSKKWTLIILINKCKPCF